MELRLYSFVNFYLSSIQQGIQTGHVAVDLVRKYTANVNPLNREIYPQKQDMVENWADNHKTFITLNGGNAAGIQEITDVITRNNTFPWAIFKEDEQSLGGIQTCVAVILPENIFNARWDPSAINEQNTGMYSFVEEDPNGVPMTTYYDKDHRHFELIKMLKSCRLAS